MITSYDELKAEMKTIKQQMAEAKKKERTNALNEVKRLCKEFGFVCGPEWPSNGASADHCLWQSWHISFWKQVIC